jgi:hypothetical protein
VTLPYWDKAEELRPIRTRILIFSAVPNRHKMAWLVNMTGTACVHTNMGWFRATTLYRLRTPYISLHTCHSHRSSTSITTSHGQLQKAWTRSDRMIPSQYCSKVRADHPICSFRKNIDEMGPGLDVFDLVLPKAS